MGNTKMKFVYLIFLLTQIISLLYSTKIKRTHRNKGIWGSLVKGGLNMLNGYVNPESVKENKNTVPESKDMKKVKDDEKKKKNKQPFNLMNVIKPLAQGKDLTSVLGAA